MKPMYTKRSASFAWALASVLTSLSLVGCTSEATTVREAGESEILATVAGNPVTMDEVREQIGGQLDQLDSKYQQQRSQMIEQRLEQLLRTRVLEHEATEQGITAKELVDAEIDKHVQITDADIAAWYEENETVAMGRSLEELTPRITTLLRNNQGTPFAEDLVRRLREEHDVVYHFEPFRLEFDNEGSPADGPADAPVTLVEFSDFECPFCARFFPTLKQLKENYGDQLRVVYRQFPLSNLHPNAIKAAQASLCAHEQGEFWGMHDLLFEEQDRLDDEALKERADKLEMDRQAFDLCLGLSHHTETIRRDMTEGRAAGVNGTPALFVNGMSVPGGAAGYDVVAKMIDAELERASK